MQQPLSTLMTSVWEIAEGQPSCTQLHWAFIGQHVVKVCGQSVCYESAQDHRRTSRLFSWMAALNCAAEAAGIHICSLLKNVAVVVMSLGPGIWCRGSRSCLLLSCMLWDMLVVVASSYWSREPQPLSAFIPSASRGKCVHVCSCMRETKVVFRSSFNMPSFSMNKHYNFSHWYAFVTIKYN